MLKSEIFTFIGKELKKIQRVLSSDCPEDLENQLEDGDLLEDEDKDERRSTRDAVVKITMYFLMRMKQQRLADCLQKSTGYSEYLLICQQIDQLMFKHSFFSRLKR